MILILFVWYWQTEYYMVTSLTDLVSFINTHKYNTNWSQVKLILFVQYWQAEYYMITSQTDHVQFTPTGWKQHDHKSNWSCLVHFYKLKTTWSQVKLIMFSLHLQAENYMITSQIMILFSWHPQAESNMITSQTDLV